jgi:hypothetical protein
MATTASTLVSRVRRFIRDWPDYDAITASVSSSGTTLTVADASTVVYSPRWAVEVEQEAMLVRSGTGTTLTVKRGALGTTAASHASGSAVLIRPQFLSQDILEALNSGIQNAFPLIYKPVLDTSLTVLANTFEYTIPSTLPRVSRVELKSVGDYDYNEVKDWDIRRAATPKLQFRREPETGATIRIHGFGPFAELAFTDSLDAQWPTNAEDYLVYYAVAYLTASGEAGRVRVDTGAIDDREQANRVGSSMSASNYLFQRAQKRLVDAALPPMPKHVKAVL